MNYYNEFDPAAAAWLRELIALGLLPPGEVDERSIKDVRSSDLGYDQCHFFAGIGGWSLALRLAGWPEDRPVWTGSCPCQPYSTAGKQRGNADERDLWPEFFRLIAERRPEFIFGEQVENAVRHGWLDRVCRDLEGEGYAVGAAVLGAHSVGAPHRRQRLYWGAVSVPHAARIGRNEWRSRTGRRGALSGCGADGMAENADGGGRGGRSDGNTHGNNGKIQTPGLCRDSRMDDLQSIGWRIYDSENKRAPTGEIHSSANAGCGCSRVADSLRERLERHSGDERKGSESGRNGETTDRPAAEDGISGLSPWEGFQLIFCRDGKVRRIPAESLLFRMADGVSEGVDGRGAAGISETGGFPLTAQREGNAMLLKGYGNAVVPQLAAEFIKAFMKSTGDMV